jgi:hypothetical protein
LGCYGPKPEKRTHPSFWDLYFPQSFSFQLLRLVFLLFAEAKVSGQRYYNVMVRQTNNSFPHLVPDQYREFLRVQRQWAHVQDLKRAGSAEFCNTMAQLAILHSDALPVHGGTSTTLKATLQHLHGAHN